MRSPRVWATLAVAFTLGSGCGTEVPAGGVKSPDAIPTRDLKVSRRVEPEELLPRDLDLCLRIDLARLKESLGPPPKSLVAQLGDDALLEKAMQKARSVTIGLRVSDLEVGDRVVSVEGDLAGLTPDSEVYREEKTENDRVRLFERREEAERGQTAAIVLLDDRALVFVSAVELDSVRRVLVHGPDKERPDPTAEGVVSLHYKPRRLAPSLEQRFPSVGKLIAELGDVKGTATVPEEGVVVDMTIVAKSEAGATRAAKFIDVIRTNADDPALTKLLKGLDTELTGTSLHVRWVIPPEIVLDALKDRGDDTPRPKGRAGSFPADPPRGE